MKQKKRLTIEQKKRYARQIKEIGETAQLKLLNSRVLIIGAGGLGSLISTYLVSAGIGTVGLMDSGKVEISNLNRQLLYNTKDLKKSKVNIAKKRLHELNPDVNINIYPIKCDKMNIKKFVYNYDFIVDATDDFKTKYIINDTCVKLKRPFSHAGVKGFFGQVFTYVPGHFCLRCIFPNRPKTIFKQGILGPTAGVLASIQAIEIIKYISQKGRCLKDNLLVIDLQSMEIKKQKVKKNKRCYCSS